MLQVCDVGQFLKFLVFISRLQVNFMLGALYYRRMLTSVHWQDAEQTQLTLDEQSDCLAVFADFLKLVMWPSDRYAEGKSEFSSK